MSLNIPTYALYLLILRRECRVGDDAPPCRIDGDDAGPLLCGTPALSNRGGQVALFGVVVGVLAAVGLTRYTQTLLFDVHRLDVTAFAGMTVRGESEVAFQ